MDVALSSLAFYSSSVWAAATLEDVEDEESTRLLLFASVDWMFIMVKLYILFFKIIN